MTGPRGKHVKCNASGTFSGSHAFAAFDTESARRYDAWYEEGKGRAVAIEEEMLLADHLASFPGAASVLEVGCGTGHFSRWLASQGLQVMGLEPSAAMLQVAVERGGGPAYTAGSAERLPFPDGSFDLVALITSLEFMSDPATALREAGRVARLGLLLGVLNLASPLGLSRKAMALVRPSPYSAARFYTPWSLGRLVRLALGNRLNSMEWKTAVWPGWAPDWTHILPFGAFIGAAASVRHEGK